MNYFIIFLEICCFFYIQYMFFETTLNQYVVKTSTCSLYCGCAFLICLLSMIPFILPWTWFLCMASVLLLCWYIYHDRKEFRSVFLLQILVLMSVCCLQLAYTTFVQSPFAYYEQIACSLLLMTFIYLCFMKQKRQLYPMIIKALLIFITLLLQLSFYHKVQSDLICLIGIGMLLLMILLYRNCFRIVSSQQNILDITTKRYTQKENSEKYERIKEENERIHQQMHDLKKHLNLLESGNLTDEITQYKEAVIEKADTLLYKSYSGNILLDRILQTYQKRLRNIHLNIELDEGCLASFDPIDLCSIFCNLLDNALESCEKCTDKLIHIRIKEGKERLVIIKMKNSCQGIIEEQGTLKSTKINQLYHGYGMHNMSIIATSYHGKLKYEYDEKNNIFTTILHLYKDDPLV